MTSLPQAQAAHNPTPGPWRADGPDVFGDFNILHDGNSLAVAAVVSNMRHPNEVAANARLIAAAFDLYNALNDAINVIGILAEKQASPVLAEIIRARTPWLNALAKAEGRTIKAGGG